MNWSRINKLVKVFTGIVKLGKEVVEVIKEIFNILG